MAISTNSKTKYRVLIILLAFFIVGGYYKYVEEPQTPVQRNIKNIQTKRQNPRNKQRQRIPSGHNVRIRRHVNSVEKVELTDVENEKTFEEVEDSFDDQKFSKDPEFYNSEVFDNDNELRIAFVEATSTTPSTTDPIIEAIPVPQIPTQPMTQEKQLISVYDYESEDVFKKSFEIRIIPRQNLMCLDMAMAAVVIAGIVVMLVILLHTLIEWITTNENCEKLPIYHTSLVAKMDPEQAKAILFARTPQIHKV